MNWNYAIVAILALAISLLYEIRGIVKRIEKNLNK
jgi:hypothetical protein